SFYRTAPIFFIPLGAGYGSTTQSISASLDRATGFAWYRVPVAAPGPVSASVDRSHARSAVFFLFAKDRCSDSASIRAVFNPWESHFQSLGRSVIAHRLHGPTSRYPIMASWHTRIKQAWETN